MGRALHNLARVLEVADELHQEGQITKETLIKIVEAAETTVKDSDLFINELKKWAVDLLQIDDVANVRRVLKAVLIAFLQSPDADERQLRGHALIILEQVDKLLLAAEGYDQNGLTLNLLADG